MVLEAPSFPFPEHVGGPFGPPPFPFPVGFGAKNFEASRLCMQMAAEAWPVGRIGILESDQGVFAGTGALNRSQLQLHPLCHPPCLVACETFDGREASRVHRMEVLPTNSERSSITLDIRDLVWLAFLACEVVERRPAKPRGQI